MIDGFVRIAAITPDLRVADCTGNAAETVRAAQRAAQAGASVAVFPELGLTGYTCGDLFLQDALVRGAQEALSVVLAGTANLDLLLAVGLPVRCGAALYNCAAVLCAGRILGLVPKTHIPNYGEFYELRHFAPGEGVDEEVELCGQRVRLCARQLFACKEMPDLVVGVEICEDLWVPAPPSEALALSGATVLLNLSASDEIIGKAAYRRSLVQGQSGRLLCAYAYADAGRGESTQDMVFAGHDLIAENGTILAETKRFRNEMAICDVDVQRLAADRRRSNTFAPGAALPRTAFSLPLRELSLLREIPPTPFVPQSQAHLAERCEEILALQAGGLVTRLKHTGIRRAVVGLSGGLDSTLALIVMAHAFDDLNLPRSGILAVTMPGFGTTSRTRGNAEKLAEAYGVELRTVSISKAVEQHFADIGQNMNDHDVTYENSQARERTQVLMDIANKIGGLVVGTGDLSELALGWATYNGDHMSMYGVNASIPKTLVRHLVSYVCGDKAESEPELSHVLADILDTPVSPELLPAVNGQISQKTEDLVGPYELHDFFLYYAIRWGFPPKKVLRLAEHAFGRTYDRATILRWEKTFYRRFFAQQFKRSCLPDGPKVGSVTLSPRGDWRMPSDAAASLWLDELEGLA